MLTFAEGYHYCRSDGGSPRGSSHQFLERMLVRARSNLDTYCLV